MKELLTWLDERTDDILSYLGQIVEIESPSDNPAATGEMNRFFQSTLRDLDFETELIENQEVGPHLLARRGKGSGERILVLCHIDTVWAVGETASRPFTVDGDVARGPGICDMKGGVAQLVYALKALKALDLEPSRPLTLLFNTDEEIGSPTSRGLIEAEAKKSSAVLVLEPPIGPEGLLKTFRKGVGMFTVTARGRAAHAGADHSSGINAVEELAWQTITLQSMTDPAAGTTVNVGVVNGGTRSNVVPALATARVDVRVSSLVEGQRVEKAILALRPRLPGASLEVTGGINRPPMERTPAGVRLFEKARALGAEMGLELKEGGTGGASDGNFTSALGIPTLDGLGSVGGGGHAIDEYVKIGELAPRAALIARLLMEI